MNLDSPEERTSLAAEYVMGTLTAREREQFESALASDDALLAEVYRWQDHLLGLALQVAPVEPAPDLWTSIDAAVRGRLESASRSDTRRMADGERPTGSPAGIPVRRLRWWQFVAVCSTTAAVVLATVLVLRSAPQEATRRYVTVLQAEDKSTGWLVEVTAGDRLRLVPVGPSVVVPPGKSLQLWTKLDGAAGPTSLGLVTPGRSVEIPLDRLPGVEENQLFELTLEPEAGSPLDRPTGPILYIGRSVRL